MPSYFIWKSWIWGSTNNDEELSYIVMKVNNKTNNGLYLLSP